MIDDLLNAWGDSPADNRGDDAIVSITDNNRASIADPASGFFLDEVKDARVEIGVGGNPVHLLVFDDSRMRVNTYTHKYKVTSTAE